MRYIFRVTQQIHLYHKDHNLSVHAYSQTGDIFEVGLHAHMIKCCYFPRLTFDLQPLFAFKS